MARYCYLTVALLLIGCHAEVPKGVFRGPVLSSGRDQLYQHFDHEVTLVGRAQADDEEGAIVALADRTPVRVVELKQWPARTAGHPVTVAGVLRRWAGATQDQDRFTIQGVRWLPGDEVLKKAKR